MDGLRTNDGYPYLSWQEDDPPTPVELSTFTAVYTNGSSLLEWTTQSESNNLGWNVYRSQTELEDAVQINGHLITGAGTTTEPTEYEFFDEQELIVNNTYWYWLESVGFYGETEIYNPISLTIPEPGEDPDYPDEEMFILHNYPNPFTPITNIKFNVPQETKATLSIFNIKGQVVEKAEFSEGNHTFKWNAENYNSGIYYYKLEIDNYNEIKKMILLK